MACRHLRGIRDETLPHVLQHCPGNTRAIDDRDDRVLAMIKKAAEPTVAKPGSQLTARFDACLKRRIYAKSVGNVQAKADLENLRKTLYVRISVNIKMSNPVLWQG
ncbi:hypothetical protein JG687_00006137 [Phytophthora cactorum]|uniref:Uncharacterized protein n=1 Tax=Phytophthora cactorum TaxID=29920 RepID=A0A8T1UJ61_9STRA|nr:hypothetical protein JG687_00006137 [Phytophthora cactorum]